MYRNNPYISALAKERCTAVSGTPKPITQTTLCGWAGRWSEGHDVTPKPCRKKEERERERPNYDYEHYCPSWKGTRGEQPPKR